MKVCKVCCTAKSTLEFNTQKSCKDGLRSTCKVCRKTESKLWYDNKKDVLKQYYADVYMANPHKYNARSSQWKKNNPTKRAAHRAKRRAVELNAMPKWADQSKIQIMYKLAYVMSKISAHKYHVDHIIPLQGKNVCGFHIESNLQVIKASENLSKGNNYA